ncbi:1-acyl-sn-glycerol-3-phosphate acyltransferase [Anianabacter salinae]|uniref:1-acyl-sn-glycerol-3-phosphate acyltransferase n=1 Tax=Anianabacter salinae TaxID=2851023 RepID=UPI00225E483E|nr:1-acyl-sn-glycerol-3-phosphate acyltransferase [Anianabacter salinae]MBV0913004.1 1-acyl-sn-glycerol-3-phosphate acyltransferase [Anianabacter salinae]
MFQTVAVPVWLLTLILAFAAVTFASHFLFPSVRWFFRRRAERLVAELNKRLDRPIQPFKLLRRYDTIQRLIYDPKVIEAVADHARKEGIPENVAFERARDYAREIVPRFSPSSYFGFATRATRWLSEALYDVEVDQGDPEAFTAIDRDATIIFVMNHRSNMDYVLVTYLAARHSALSYAVGEWARIWPLSSLIRSMGAFFIRRRSRNALYRRVLARYVQMATRGGVTQAIFPEGGLSLTGRVEPPKLGLLSYILDDFDPEAGRDVVFVPVALNYDRVLEDRVLIEAAGTGERRFRASIPQAIAFAARFFWRRLIGRGRRFGRAGVAYGTPVSLVVLTRRGLQSPEAVGEVLMDAIRARVPVLPVPLVAQALLAEDGTATEETIAVRITDMIAGRDLAAETPETLARAGLATLRTRRLLRHTDGRFEVAPDQSEVLAFYARSIAHRTGLAGTAEKLTKT